MYEQGYSTSRDGTGLDLSIAQQLARAHGWKISLDPSADGARFVVSGCEASPAVATGDEPRDPRPVTDDAGERTDRGDRSHAESA